MRSVHALLAVLLILISLSNAGAVEQQAWICTWLGYGKDRRPVIEKFRVEGEHLIQESFGLRYRILQNSPHAIIAAWSIAKVEPNNSTPSIGTFVIIINKETFVFRRSNVILDDPGESTRYGSCINDLHESP